MPSLKNAMMLKCYLFRKAHSSEQTFFARVFLSGTPFTAELTEAMQIKCLAQRHNIQIQLGFEPSMSLIRN